MAELDWNRVHDWPTLLEVAPESDGIDLSALRLGRRARVRAEMAARDIDVLILSDAVNIRYATGTRNMQVFTSRNAPSRYLVLTADRSILFEFTGSEHVADGFETVDEVRPASTASFVAAGPAIAEVERAWAADMASLVRELVGSTRCRVGIERLNAGVSLALADEGLVLVDAQEPVERARAIKSAEELACIRASVAMTERAVATMEAAIEPGLTESELWSVFVGAVAAGNGDYVETRLLNSGPQSNPWFREAGNRVIQAGDLVALDTDVVGCHGYYADFSRTFFVGPGTPTPAQRECYRLALEQIEHNTACIGPGVTFREYADAAWDIPERYHAHRYYLSAHGNGMTGEYPYLYHRADFDAAGYDGVIEPGMTLCVESFIGAADGGPGVKLEQQLLVTDAGTEVLSHYPFDAALSP